MALEPLGTPINPYPHLLQSPLMIGISVDHNLITQELYTYFYSAMYEFSSKSQAPLRRVEVTTLFYNAAATRLVYGVGW